MVYLDSCYFILSNTPEKGKLNQPKVLYISTFAFSIASLWIIFPQLTVIQFGTVVGRGGIFLTSAIKALALYLSIRLIQKPRWKQRSSGILFSLILLGTIPQSTSKLLHFMNKESKTYNYNRELEIAQKTLNFVPEGSIISTSAQNVFRSIYLHQPFESFFNNKKFKIYFDKKIENAYRNAINKNPSARKIYFLDVHKSKHVLQYSPKNFASKNNFKVLKEFEKFRIWELAL